MKKITKRIAVIGIAAILSFAVVSLSCGGKKVHGSADTVFAETRTAAVQYDSIEVLEGLQNAFRSISAALLPAVVEVDVTETRTVQSMNPFDSLPWFFFGRPNQNDDDNDNKNNKGRERQYESQGLGSGVIVRRTGNTIYVLTNNHVAGEATKISIKLNDGREFEGKLVGADERMDIALLSFESGDDTIPVAALGNSDNVQTGDICFAMGAPLGYSQSVTQGIISATGRSGSGIGSISDFIQTDAAINQGNSGGPLVNIYGEVIGINTWIASQSGGSQGLGFSIPINNIKSAIDDFITSGKVTYGWLGVSLVEVTNDYKEALGLTKGQEGAFVSQLFIGSPAQKGGMQPGDFVVELNGRNVRDVNQLVRDVGALKAGSTAKFVVLRGGKKQSISVKIEERDEKASGDNSKLWPGFIAVPLTDNLRKQLNVPERVSGVAITSVQEKTPAASLRLQNNDVISAVNGVAIKDLAEFYTELSKATKSINFDVQTSSGGTITTGTYRF